MNANGPEQLPLCRFDDCGALFSPCRKFRYALWRIWDDQKKYATFICLNPSTADEISDDPTVRRCIDYSKRWGFGGYFMLNLFAYRATLPEEMKKEKDPVGLENDQRIIEITNEAGIIIAAWGNHGSYLDRDKKVLALLRQDIYCLKQNADGQPAHPLYLKKTLTPILYKP